MGRNLVICCDGTNNSVVGGATNVLHLFGSLVRDENQVIFYDSGVGTLTDPTRVTPVGRWFSRQVDMAVGNSLGRSVCAAYRFLCQHWQEGDQVYLFGFSRGAYAVRALAGMVHFLGLLRADLDSLVPLAWNIYADENRNLTTSDLFSGGNRFAKLFSRHRQIPIHFLGAWDTVSSFGWIWDVRSLPHSARCPNVRHVRHAVAIDETRAFFPVLPFRRDSSASGGQESEVSVEEPVINAEEDTVVEAQEDEDGNPLLNFTLKRIEVRQTTDVHRATTEGTFREVWFSGVHCDVGGGYPESESGLSKIPLDWMFRESEQAGLRMDDRERDILLGRTARRGRKKTPPDPLAEQHMSSRGLWHALELIPRKQWNAELETKCWHAPNFFRPRPIPGFAAIHPSVKLRIDGRKDYRPPNLPENPNFGDLNGPL